MTTPDMGHEKQQLHKQSSGSSCNSSQAVNAFGRSVKYCHCDMLVQDAEDESADKHEVHHEEHPQVWWNPEGQLEQQQGCFPHGQCSQQQGP